MLYFNKKNNWYVSFLSLIILYLYMFYSLFVRIYVFHFLWISQLLYRSFSQVFIFIFYHWKNKVEQS